MGNFVSVLGEWKPAKEVVSMVNNFGKTIKSPLIIGPDGKHEALKGEVFIYKGPDREAVKMLKEEGVESLGQCFKNNPEFLQSIRNMGFNNIEEYFKQIGFDEGKEICSLKINISFTD